MKDERKYNIVAIITIFWLLVIAGFLGWTIKPSITEEGFSVEIKSNGLVLANESKKAIVETEDGEIEMDLPTVESVDNESTDDCGDEECGIGKFIYAPTETPQMFKDYVIGKCWDTDGHYGGQCWDLMDMLWQNVTGRNLSTCGTHYAKGVWNCKEYNAGDEFEYFDYPYEIKTGDVLVFGNGVTGHIGMAVGSEHNGYVALLGQNQGGIPCEGGGSSANIINISTSNIIGIFRLKKWIIPDPEPQPIPISGCLDWNVKRGDTMSGIMLNCEGTVVYGEPMNDYAKTWFSTIFKPGQSVYDGWLSPSGVGLYAGDVIDHEVK